MARRSAQNPRYQRDAKIGSTRRSAASAKPKRESGTSGGSGGKKSSSASKSKARVPFEPDTPEFKRWRKIWLGLLVAAIVFSVGAWYGKETPAGTLGLVFAYSTLFSALYIDLTKIRRMRKEWQAQNSTDSKKKDVKKSEAKDDKKAIADDVRVDKSVKLTDKIVGGVKGMFGGKKGDA